MFDNPNLEPLPKTCPQITLRTLVERWAYGRDADDAPMTSDPTPHDLGIGYALDAATNVDRYLVFATCDLEYVTDERGIPYGFDRAESLTFVDGLIRKTGRLIADDVRDILDRLAALADGSDEALRRDHPREI